MKKLNSLVHGVTTKLSVIDWFIVKVLLVGIGILIGIYFERYFAPFLMLKVLVVLSAFFYVIGKVIYIFTKAEV